MLQTFLTCTIVLSHYISQVTLQYVQVYLDAAYDLLATSSRDAAKPLEVRLF